MRLNKKVFSLALAGVLACGSIGVFAGSDSKQALKLKGANLLVEKQDAKLQDEITKGDALMLVLGALGYGEEVNKDEKYIAMNSFIDVSDEYKGYVGLASDLGLAVGKDGKTLEADKTIKKRDFLAILLKVLNYKDAFSDTENLAKQAGFAIEEEDFGTMVTREEAIRYVFKMLNKELQNGTKMKLGEYLVKTNVISEKKAEELGVKTVLQDKEDVHIIYFNDFHGNVAEEVTKKKRNIGMAKMVGYVNEFVAKNPNTIVLSGGDNYQGTADSNLTFGKPVTAMMKGMRTIASAVGNHEFDWGYEKIEGWAKDGNFKYLASNIYEKDTNKPVKWANPYMIVKKGGIKIGLIGLAHPETPSLTKAEYVSGFEFRDPVTSAKEWVKFLKDGKAKEGKPDVIVALTHIDSDQNAETMEVTGGATKLAEQVEGLDLVLSAHSHRMVNGKVNNVPILQAYCYGRAIGHVKIDVDKMKVKVQEKKADKEMKASKKKMKAKAKPKFKTKYSVKGIETGIFESNVVKDKIIVDAVAEKFYTDLQAELEPINGEVLGEAVEAFTHSRGDKGGVTLLGRWACETMAEAAKADIAIQNGGGLRRTLEKGQITMGDLYEIMPFDNYLVIMDLKGKDIKKAIDHGIHMPKTTDGAFSGLKVEYDGTKPYESKITKITLSDGTPLEDEKTYRVATNDFMFGEGKGVAGDGYDFSGATNVSITIPIRDVFVEKIKKEGKITPKKVDFIKDISK